MRSTILVALCIVGSAAELDESALLQTTVRNNASVGVFPCNARLAASASSFDPDAGKSFCTPHFFFNGAQKSGSVKFYKAMMQSKSYVYATKDAWGGSHPFKFHWKAQSMANPGSEKVVEVCARNNMQKSYNKMFHDVPAPATGNEVSTFTGEFGPNNLHCICCPSTFKKMFPDAKHIVMLRNPFTRSVKRHMENLEQQGRDSHLTGKTWAEWRDARLPELKTCMASASTPEDQAKCATSDAVFGWSTYVSFLKHWASQGYSKENLLVLYSDDWYADPTAVMRKVEKFMNMKAGTYDNAALKYDVGVPHSSHDFTRTHRDGGDGEISAGLTEYLDKRRALYFKDDAGQEALLQHFRDSVKELADFCKAQDWQAPPAAWAKSLENSAGVQVDFEEYEAIDDPHIAKLR